MFRFASPWMLLLALPAIAAAWALFRRRRTGDARLRMPQTSDLAALGGRTPWLVVESWLPWARGLVLLLLVAALGRPQAGAQLETVSTLGVDIVVALDISGSMRAEDFQPKNRLEVARRTVESFIEGRAMDRIGLVVFAGLATTRAPLTLDHEMLGQFLSELDFAPPEQDGTAIGMGLATAVNRLRESDARSRVVVLVTDGMNNRGQIGPKAAAEAARALGIKVYTIGVGSDREVPIPLGGLGRRLVRVELDEELLQSIAETTGGTYFRATDAEALVEVFETIDDLEKTEIESKVRVVYSELFHYLLFPGVALLFLERLLATTRLGRIP